MEIVGIANTHKFSQKTFAESMKLPYPLLSDFPKAQVIKEYGVDQLHGTQLFARQSFFLVDKKGIVRGVWAQRPAKPDEEAAPDPLFPSDPILELARKVNKEG